MTRSAPKANGLADVRRGPPDSRGSRAATFSGSSYNAADHTVQAVLSAGTRVIRGGYFAYGEELDVSPAAVDVTRVAAGLVPFLDAHATDSMGAVLGRVLSVSFENGQLIGLIQFNQTAQGAVAEGMVSRGELTGISIGYAVSVWRMIEIDASGVEIWSAGQWELLEASLVPVPADPAAGVRSAAANPSTPAPNGALTQEEEDMQTRSLPGGAAAPAAPAVVTPLAAVPAADAVVRFGSIEALDFVEQARTFGVEARGRELVTQNAAGQFSVEAARTALLASAADHQRARSAPLTLGVTAEVTLDARDKMRSAVTSALLHRFSPDNKLDDKIGAADFRGMTLLEIGRRNLEANGEKINGKSKREIADMCLRANSTSDFPNILANVANKTLRDGYGTAAQTFKQWARASTMPDFKPMNRVQLGGAPGLLAVPEGGEIKRGTIGDGKEVYALGTYGRIFSITRQTLVNDDLDAFTRIPMMFGRAAADLESDTVYGILMANPNMGDGNPLFGNAHGNLAAAAGAVSIASIQSAQIGMGSQVGLEGRPINITPKWLVGGTSTWVPAVQLLKPVVSTKTGDVNPYQDMFTPIIEQRLNGGAAATPWFLIADYNQVDTVEYAYLEGEDGVFLDERIGFEVEGIEYKARLDFAAKAIDWRGMYKNGGVING